MVLTPMAQSMARLTKKLMQALHLYILTDFNWVRIKVVTLIEYSTLVHELVFGTVWIYNIS